MSDIFHDRVRETCTGTNGSFTLLGAVVQYQSFSVVGNGNTCRYTVLDAGGVKWGTFSGVWQTGGTLTRVTTHESSNGVGAAVTFGAGTHAVFLTPDSTSVAFPQNVNTFTERQNIYRTGTGNSDAAFAIVASWAPVAANHSAFGVYQYLTVPDTVSVNTNYLWGMSEEIEYIGTGNSQLLVGGDHGVYISGPGVHSAVYGVRSQVINYGAGTIGALAGARISGSANYGGGTITNNYGVKVENQTAGTNNWAIKTGLGKVEFGDQVQIDGTANNLVLAGSTTTNPVTLTATGSDASIPIKLAPKGPQGFVQLGPDTYGAAGWAGNDVNIELYEDASPSATSYGVYVEKHAGDYAGSVVRALSFIVGTQGVGATQDIDQVIGIVGVAYTNLPVGRTTTQAVGIQGYTRNYGAGTLVSASGMLVPSAVNSGGGTITNNYGVKVENQTAGTNNWAIKTGLGKVEFGDQVQIDGTANNLVLAGSTTTNPVTIAATGTDSSVAIKFETKGPKGMVWFGDTPWFAGDSTWSTKVDVTEDVSQTRINYGFTSAIGAAEISNSWAIGASFYGSIPASNSGVAQRATGGQLLAYSYLGVGKTVSFISGAEAVVGNYGAGTVTNAYGLATGVEADTGAITNGSGIKVGSGAVYSGGTITNNYGIKVENQTAGTNNWAIKTGLGKVEFRDELFHYPITGTLKPYGATFYNSQTENASSYTVNLTADFSGSSNHTGQVGNLITSVGYSSTGTCADITAVFVDSNYTYGSPGVISNNLGLRIGDQTAGTNNWAIKTGLGLVDLGDNLKIAKYIEGAEMTAPAAPAANGFRLYAEDDGAGKTRLMALFSSGAAQQLAIQP